MKRPSAQIERAQRLKDQIERAQRMKEAHAEVRRVVATGICPKCGRKLRRNWSLTGWWQCEQLGAPGFRADPSQPPCDWQGFTE